ncbi:MAG: GDP-mannose 4,6-dehydratase [Acidocella sp.]|nr:GDP-mannose 4,6-dehydratase [Acidocella sp.]
MQKILLTGADGFVGRHLRPMLQTAFAGADIVATHVHQLDVTDAAATAAFIDNLQPDACIHLAGVTAVDDAKRAPEKAWAVNFQGALNVGTAILQHAPQCRMILISSGECYGASFKTGEALDETALLVPLNLYAATKAAAEIALGAMTSDGLRLLRLRPFNHTGPGQREAFVVPAFAGQMARIEAGLTAPQIKVGALTPERDFLDVRDVCAAYVLALQKFDVLPNNSVFNIASGLAVRIGDVLETLLEQARCPIGIVTDPARLRRVEIDCAIGDATLARRVLGWAPQYELGATLLSVLEAARRVVHGASS